jgi:ATP-binding cassette subfamily B protein
LALASLLAVPLSLLATRMIAQRSQRLFVAQWASTGRLNAHVEETYSGFALVKTFGHRAWAEEGFGELNADVYRASFAAQFCSGLVAP